MIDCILVPLTFGRIVLAIFGFRVTTDGFGPELRGVGDEYRLVYNLTDVCGDIVSIVYLIHRIVLGEIGFELSSALGEALVVGLLLYGLGRNFLNYFGASL